MRSRLTLFFLPFHLGLDIACSALDIAHIGLCRQRGKRYGGSTAASGKADPLPSA
ncbi:hypothetical protein [Streptomyces mirabilis]|uniref:hypothetical protein n=1 Tax=Streptomyces mirabilis TaxID=68239 RepID=UPI003656E58D